MPVLTVGLGDGERRIPFEPGRSVRDILDATDLRVRSGCRGLGSCGLCRVRIEAGEAGAPTCNEQVSLGGAELGRGVRLACQVTPEGDLGISILAPAPKSDWRSLPGGEGVPAAHQPPVRQEPPGGVTASYGVAVDLGTTHIRLSLYDLNSGEWLAGRYGPNPQWRYGSDIMTRLVAACQSWELALEMGRLVIEALAAALLDLAVREGIDIGRVTRLFLVGNTAMLALLSGRNHRLLLEPGHWQARIDCLPDDPASWAGPLGIHPRAEIEVLPPLAGFVGSDLLAGVAATRLTEGAAGGLFIDFGTNSEIALWDGRILWVTSAAGGPAFEESGVSCGTPAEAGAINRVVLGDGEPEFRVIGDGEPAGLCGSGLVDLIAGLVRSGRLSETGRFDSSVPPEGFTLARGARDIVLTRRDVDLFQRAKAAIGAGIQLLLARAGMGWEGVGRVCVGGFFGRFLDPANAREVGLLPGVEKETVELCGSTALAGCAEALLCPCACRRLKGLADLARHVDLSRGADFDELFLENLYLRPMGGR